MLRNLLLSTTKFAFAKEVQKTAVKTGQASGLTYYKDGQLTTRSQIVLKKSEDIESYVIKTIQAYYRTTYKQGTQCVNAGLKKESKLADHGLDSLDSIEIAMQI